MKLKNFATHLIKTSNNITDIEKSIVYVFCQKNNCDFKKSQFMTNYFSCINHGLVEVVEKQVYKLKHTFDLYTLIELFELLIPTNEIKENGMVYTPSTIKNYILKATLPPNRVPIVCDPACGCGSFLLSAAEYIHERYNISFSEMFEKYIFGVDIITHNIDKCKILFHLLALLHNEIIEQNFNLTVGNSLTLDWGYSFPNMSGKKSDCVIGNPPYVRSKNLSTATKESMKRWKSSQPGNVDLYIPFYELGFSLLNGNGKLGYIS